MQVSILFSATLPVGLFGSILKTLAKSFKASSNSFTFMEHSPRRYQALVISGFISMIFVHMDLAFSQSFSHGNSGYVGLRLHSTHFYPYNHPWSRTDLGLKFEIHGKTLYYSILGPFSYTVGVSHFLYAGRINRYV